MLLAVGIGIPGRSVYYAILNSICSPWMSRRCRELETWGRVAVYRACPRGLETSALLALVQPFLQIDFGR